MQTAIFRSQVFTPFGTFDIAVDSTKQDARSDIFTIMSSELNCHVGLLKIGKVVKSNRRVIAKLNPIKNATSNNEHWAWVKRSK